MGCVQGHHTNKKALKKLPSKLPSYVRTMSTAVDLKINYQIGKKLGSGSFGKVFIGKNLKDETIKMAIKKISKKGMSESDL